MEASLVDIGGMRVLAAMSGGVDSAVAAARAVEAGHDVVGVHLALSARRRHPAHRQPRLLHDRGLDGRAAAPPTVLGIPFYVWDFSERFRDDVVDDFVAEYSAGRTPNPCMRCNERIKFAAVLEKALDLGFDAVCTGHYAIVGRMPPATASCTARATAAKDQSLRARRAHGRAARAHACSRSARRRPRRWCAPRRRRAA